ncbi:MAG: TolC family protein [Sedimentisphaerales bacterium]|nr:TolC family protein [Sedimentisphaerales bacterium]
MSKQMTEGSRQMTDKKRRWTKVLGTPCGGRGTKDDSSCVIRSSCRGRPALESRARCPRHGWTMDEVLLALRLSSLVRRPSFIRSSVFCLLISVLCLMCGCDLFSKKDPYALQIPPERFRKVQTLELKEAKPEEQVRDINDVNEAPAKELELSLEQCRAMTLENNLELKVQLISPAMAAERVSQEEARFEAAFTSNVNYVKQDTPTASFLDEISGSQTDYFGAGLGVQVPLRTGGTINFDMADARLKTGSPYSIFDPSYSSDMSLSISQPLLRNAGRRVNTYSIRIAEYERQITDARTKLEVISVIAAVDRVYWRLYAARRELEVRKKQYDLAEALYQQALRFVDAGDKPQVEVIRTEAGVAQQLEAIIISENNVRDRERELKRTLNKVGLGMQTPTVLIPGTEPDPVRYELERKRLVTTAMEHRMELLELELQIAEDVAGVEYAKNQTLPLVTLGYTYNINGLGATRDDSFDLLFDTRFEDHRVGLQLEVPLGNGAAKSRLRQAFYQRRQRLASRENRQAMIELEVLNAVDQLEANWQRVLASRQSTILDGRLFEAEKRQFELGLNTSTDVLQTQANFANSQSAEIQALAEYQIALVDLAYATGTLLGAAKVGWEPIVPTTD